MPSAVLDARQAPDTSVDGASTHSPVPQGSRVLSALAPPAPAPPGGEDVSHVLLVETEVSRGCVCTSKDKLEPAREIPDEVCHILVLSAPRCHPEMREEGGVRARGPWLSLPLPRRGGPPPLVCASPCADYFSPGSLFCLWRPTHPDAVG